jgi:hypothetical protein
MSDVTHLQPVFEEEEAETVNVEETIARDGSTTTIHITHTKTSETEGYLGEWRRQEDEHETRMADIHKMSASGESIVEPMRTTAPVPSWDEILIKGAQLAKMPLNADEPVNTKTVIGPAADKPLEIDMPVFVTHMSFGALSQEIKVALAKGSAAARTATCSGEGGILEQERECAYKYIFEYVPNEYSVTPENLRASDAIEIKIGQSAKPGMGGHLPAEKVTSEIAAIRGFPEGTDIVSPARFQEEGRLASGGVRGTADRYQTGSREHRSGPRGCRSRGTGLHHDRRSGWCDRCVPEVHQTRVGRSDHLRAAPREEVPRREGRLRHLARDHGRAARFLRLREGPRHGGGRHSDRHRGADGGGVPTVQALRHGQVPRRCDDSGPGAQGQAADGHLRQEARELPVRLKQGTHGLRQNDG